MAFQIRPGQLLIIDASRVSGGITHKREKSGQTPIGDGHTEEIHTVKVVDHDQIIRESNRLVVAARYVIRALAVQTPIGFVADEGTWRLIQYGYTGRSGPQPGLVSLQLSAEALNREARAVGSARRTDIGAVALRLEIDNEAAAREIASTLRTRLAALHTACQSGDLTEIGAEIRAAKNLPSLVVGVFSDSIEYAIDCARDLRKEIRRALKGQPDAARGRIAADVAAEYDLGPIASAEGLFTDVRQTGADFGVDVSEGGF